MGQFLPFSVLSFRLILWSNRCGMAGGTPIETHSGAQYYRTPHAKYVNIIASVITASSNVQMPNVAHFALKPFHRQGDLGSRTLQPTKPVATWKAGGVAEVSWTINANRENPHSEFLVSCRKRSNGLVRL
eukprot:SAG31_NODE_1403_length_8489_cov_15.730751_2_plen_130_part_00